MGKKSKLKQQRREQNINTVQRKRTVQVLKGHRRVYDDLMFKIKSEVGQNRIYAAIKDCVVVDAQNVVDYCWKFTPDTPPESGLSPAFPNIFIEGYGVDAKGIKGYRWGVHVTCFKHDNGFSFVFTVYLGDLSGWLGKCSEMSLNTQKDGLVIIPSIRITAFEGYNEVERLNSEALGFAMITLAFMNCRNIELVDNAPSPDIQRQYQEHFGVPMTTYKTLVIRPTGKQYDHDAPQQRFDVMPLHLRRGHFKTFTEDKPRFGYAHPSNIGTLWVQATAVGNQKNGTVVKDYEVKP
jgi:hypothetical protein